MFTIGAFSHLTGVSAKRLRHYDATGLLRPAWVDPQTRYRYYAAAQIPELRRVVALIGLGIPVRRLQRLRERGSSLADELERRRSELQRERTAIERRLAELEIRLERAGDLDVVVRRRPRGRWLALAADVPPGADLAPLFVELETHARRHRARAAAPPVCVLRGVADGTRSIELLVPVDRRVPEDGALRMVSTASVPVASSLVVGGYERLPDVVSDLHLWAERTGRRVTGPPWYVYLRFGAEEELRLPEQYLTTQRDELVTEVMLELTECELTQLSRRPENPGVYAR